MSLYKVINRNIILTNLLGGSVRCLFQFFSPFLSLSLSTSFTVMIMIVDNEEIKKYLL